MVVMRVMWVWAIWAMSLAQVSQYSRVPHFSTILAMIARVNSSKTSSDWTSGSSRRRSFVSLPIPALAFAALVLVVAKSSTTAVSSFSSVSEEMRISSTLVR